MIDWREKYKKQRLIIISLVALMIGSIIAVVAGHMIRDNKPQPSRIHGQVAKKYQEGDRHFLQIEIEVDPDEYIGYDIGDEYEE